MKFLLWPVLLGTVCTGAQVTGTIAGNNSSSSPVGSIQLSNGTLTLSAADIQSFPSLCTPLTTTVGVNCTFQPAFSRTFQAASSFGSFSFSGGVFLRSSSSVTMQLQSTAVTVAVTCAGVQQGNQCSNTSATGTTATTVSGQIRIYDLAGRCVWCADFTGGVGSINGTEQLSASNSSYSGSFTATETIVTVTQGLQFLTLSPCRIADTRDAAGPYGQPFIGASVTRHFVLPGRCNIPSTAIAASLNVTVVPRGTLGFLTIWPKGASQPLTSTLNSLDGRVKANAAIVQIGQDLAVSVFVTHDTDVILDVNGYFTAPAVDTLAFYPISPCRISDTRNASGALGGPSLTAQASRTIPVLSSNCNIPSTAKAYSLNATVVPPAAFGFLTMYPTGVAQPLVSTLNALTGTIVANAAIVPAGVSGAIDVFADSTADLIIDINGYFAPPGQLGSLNFYPVSGCRVADTRLANGPLGGPAQFAGTSRDYPITASACGIPSGAKAFSLNATVVPVGPLGYLTLWPAGLNMPVVSTLNALDGAITSNAAIVPAGPSGPISSFVLATTHLIFDINGYFLP